MAVSSYLLLSKKEKPYALRGNLHALSLMHALTVYKITGG